MLRPFIHFFVIGGLLFGVKALYEGRRVQGPEITVRVPADATPSEIEASVREAILLNEAKRYGWDESDPIVFAHLVRNMRFIEPNSRHDDLTLYERALEMNMQDHDPVVRARLLYRAGEALASVPEERMPSRADLEAHRAAHPERFEREGRFRFQHVFLSRSKRGEALAADARAMRERLARLGDAAPAGLGDPLPGLGVERAATASQLRHDYGPELASLIEEAVPGSWRGPGSSVYGLHFVKVIERQAAYVPALDVIGTEVRADRMREIREALREERLATLRDAYAVRIERQP
jgi:peptidyl-prolyl cis-trans isomerase C